MAGATNAMKKSMDSGNNSQSIRLPVVSGSFYPNDKKELLLVLGGFFSQTKKIISQNIKALIVPHAGYIYSGLTAAWGYKQLTIGDQQHFVLIGPSHNYPFNNMADSSFNSWQTPLGKIKYQKSNIKNRLVISNDEIHRSEHSLEVQLPFLQYLFPQFIISCFLTGQNIDYQKYANYFQQFYSSSIFIFSSDLSHYLPDKQARVKDKKTIDAILNLDENYFIKEENTACGDQGIIILLAMAKKNNWQRKLIYYDTSATAFGDKSRVVGYSAIAFY